MSCFSCGKSFTGREKDAVAHYKKLYKEHGIERYVYRTSKNGHIKIALKESFNVIFEHHIKPNLEKGAEYFHIQEYTGT